MSAPLLFAFAHTPSQAEFELFARISGDDNPIHVDPGFSARTRFGRTVAHGMMLYALIWGALKRALPGADIAEQFLMFPNPAYAGETLDVEGRLEMQDGRETVVATVRRQATAEVVCEARCVLKEGSRP